MSNLPIKIDGDRGSERLTAEDCTFRRVHFWSCVEQAYDCHRLCLMESYLIFRYEYKLTRTNADDIFSSVFLLNKKGTAQK